MHNEECNRPEQLEDKPVDKVVDMVDVEHKLSAEDAESKPFAEAVHSMSYDFEVFEEGCEDQRNSFAKADWEEHWGVLVFYLLFRNKLSKSLNLDCADKTDRFP